jgi:hypothetical protein
MRTKENLRNKIFGYLTALKFLYRRNGRNVWLCRCRCGNTIKTTSNQLKNGKAKSCGCYRKEMTINSNTKHGFNRREHRSSKNEARFYRIWSEIKTRCFNTKRHTYRDYGGRGIKVCDRWLDFLNFRDDMYESYLKHVEEFGETNTSLDRLDNDGNYEPRNVRWATKKEQVLNRRNSSKTINQEEHVYWRRKLISMLTRWILRKPLYSGYQDLVGCTPEEFRQYIESQFEPWMNWNNYGSYTLKGPKTWNLDHIQPCYSFDLSKEADRKKCFCYTNLRPMDSKMNTGKIRKSSRKPRTKRRPMNGQR